MKFLETRSVCYLLRYGGHKVVATGCVIYFLHFLTDFKMMVNIFSVFCSYDVYNIFSDARPRESLSQASTEDVVSLDVNLEFWEENFTP